MKQNRFVHAFFIVPEILAALLAFLFACKIAIDLTKDTTAIINGAFAITVSLSVLSFAFARAVEDDPQLKDHITFAAERFLHAALLLILGSVVKYGVISLVGIKEGIWRELGRFIGGLIVLFLFSQAMLIAHTGVRILNRRLVDRMARKKDWDNVI